MDTFFSPYFHFCQELALETWAKDSLTQSLWIHHSNHTHLLASFLTRWEMVQSVLNKTVLKPAKAVSMHVSHTAHEELCMAAAGPARTVLVGTGWTSRFHVHMTAALTSFRTVLIGTGWTSSFHVHMVAALYGGREGSKYNDDERRARMFVLLPFLLY